LLPNDGLADQIFLSELWPIVQEKFFPEIEH